MAPMRLLRRGRQVTDSVAPERLPDDFTAADHELWERVRPFTMTTPGRVEALRRAVDYVVSRPVVGAIVECGVWRGGSMMAAALTLLRARVTDRDLYLFDTFTGMTDPGVEDVKQGGRHASELLDSPAFQCVADIDDVRTNMFSTGYAAERMHFIKGPVENTVPAHAPDEIAILRLDTDWYASTKHELEHLYPRLTPGGVLIIDDYAYWRGARQAVDEYFLESGVALLLVRVDGARVAVKEYW
jgi:hypothetical protein